jgi:peroxiredoxin
MSSAGPAIEKQIAAEGTVQALRQALAHARNMDTGLSEKLASYSGAVRDILPVYAEAVDRLVERLVASGAGESAPRPGEPMPPFILPDESGHLVRLEDLLSTGPLAVMFHRGHWCPWCRISAHALAQAQKRHGIADGRIVAIMPERQKFAAEFRTDAGASFPVLTDVDNGYALSLNLAIWVGPDIERILGGLGRNLPDYQGNDSWFIPIPATFVVGRDGLVRERFMDPDFRSRMATERLSAALREAENDTMT